MNSRLTSNVWRMFFASIAFTYAVSAGAASFDCAKAGTMVEHIICDTPEISKLDDELSVAYKAAVQDKQQADAIKKAQKQWMKERNGCADAGCVKRAYGARLQSFASFASHTPFDGKTTKQNVTPQIRNSLNRYCAYDSRQGSCDIDKSNDDFAICENYLNALNAPSDTLQCGERIPPGFTRPDWEEVDVIKHLNWAYQIILEQGQEPMGQTFEKWSQTFKEQIKAGQIAPQLRKIHVHQLSGDEVVTYISYKDNREGCSRPHDAPLQHGQSGFGYAYFRVLAEDPTVRLLAIGGEKGYVSTRTVSELLLFAGKPYFVQTWATDYTNPIGVDLLTFYLERSLIAKSDQEIYRVKNLYGVKRICHLLPISQ